jgi:formamidopyrimidine-DNA glycosylase
VPEYPDVVVYQERLAARTVGRPIEDVRIGNPFVLRTADPPLVSAIGREVLGVRRMGKRLVLELAAEPEPLFLVVHLMIAGRLRWKARGASHRGKDVLAVLDFPDGSVVFTEASPKKRASIHLVAGEDALASFDRGGIDVLEADLPAFVERLRSRRHTLKRALTDPTLFDGIGNAYSDEILHVARLSPFALAGRLDADARDRLHRAIGSTLRDAVQRSSGLPASELKDDKRAAMRVHGRTGEQCPECGDVVREVSFADSSLQYCAICQTGGKPLADRRLSRLLK